MTTKLLWIKYEKGGEPVTLDKLMKTLRSFAENTDSDIAFVLAPESFELASKEDVVAMLKRVLDI